MGGVIEGGEKGRERGEREGEHEERERELHYYICILDHPATFVAHIAKHNMYLSCFQCSLLLVPLRLLPL